MKNNLKELKQNAKLKVEALKKEPSGFDKIAVELVKAKNKEKEIKSSIDSQLKPLEIDIKAYGDALKENYTEQLEGGEKVVLAVGQQRVNLTPQTSIKFDVQYDELKHVLTENGLDIDDFVTKKESVIKKITVSKN